MDFGKLKDISDVDFKLPPDNPLTTQTLATVSPKVSLPNLYFGPPIWVNKSWAGKLYPSNAKEADFLYHYTRQFNTIEMLRITKFRLKKQLHVGKNQPPKVLNFARNSRK